MVSPTRKETEELCADKLISKAASLWVINHTSGADMEAFNKHRPSIRGTVDKQRVALPKAWMTDVKFLSAMARMDFRKQAVFSLVLGK